MLSFMNYRVLAAVAILLFIAAAPLPYGFYTFVKIVVFLCAGYMAYQGYATRQVGGWPWLWGIVAIVFNPVVAVRMTKEVWTVVDILIGAVFGFVAYRAFQREKQSKE